MSERIPFYYKQKYSLQETIKYIGKYVNEFHSFFSSTKNFVFVNPPVIFNTHVNKIEDAKKSRKINFDSKFNSEIYELYESVEVPFNEMVQKIVVDKNETLYTYYNSIYRDVAQTNTSSIITNKFYIEFKVVEEEINISNIQQMASQYFEFITEINKKISAVTRVKIPTYNDVSVKFVAFEDLEKKYNWTALKNQLNNCVEKETIVLITNAYWKNRQGEALFEKQNHFSDLSLTSILFIWDEQSNEAVPILKILPHSLENKTASNSATIAVEILFSNLMKLNLEKFHIGEVACSAWGKKLYENIKNKKIEIL